MHQKSAFKTILWVSLFILPFSLLAQVVSPEQFLGYKVGTRFTRHHQIVNYFTAIATAKSAIKASSVSPERWEIIAL